VHPSVLKSALDHIIRLCLTFYINIIKCIKDAILFKVSVRNKSLKKTLIPIVINVWFIRVCRNGL
jgi:hypothetical protein